ncbi:MAG: WYL domain-containing protein [Candidatus Delongbacteria bacterium]|nr:WYL domain-containing protein [Candidatus Delongbacteria bacterium]MCG2761459.1 WYL domain-containing protein [Candidatus Delongbacteria bacterium]
MSQFHRLIYIDRMIKELGYVTKQQVIDEFQVKIGSVKNDFRYMKYEVGSPITYSRKKNGYYYKEDFDLFSFGNEKMFLLFVLIKQLLSNKNFIPFDSSGILEKIKDEVDPEYLKLAGKISYEISEFEYPDLAKFETIIKAMLRRFPLDIEYLDAKGVLSNRSVEPLHILNYQGKWTLFAHCRLRNEPRMFTLSRIKDMSMNESSKFNKDRYDAGFIYDRLDQGFGIARGKKIETAVIRFYEPTLHHVIDQKWHREQITEHINDKNNHYLQFTLPVAKYEELVGRVLRFSPDAEIISPPAMRNMWLKKLKDTVKKYS